jgi:hypothetical protein
MSTQMRATSRTAPPAGHESAGAAAGARAGADAPPGADVSAGASVAAGSGLAAGASTRAGAGASVGAGVAAGGGVSAGAGTRAGGVAFDWTMVLLGLWFEGGLFLDGWAHTHRPELESFFTPWHAVLYSGFLASSAVLVGTAFRHRRGGVARPGVPAGYELSLLGVALFAAGGAADMAWHLLFGIEADVEALLSPTHLLLALGAGLILTGPLRAAWRRPAPATASWGARLPMVLSLALLLSLLTFFTQYLHPLARPWAALGNRPTVGAFAVAAADPRFLGGGVGGVFVAQALGLAGLLVPSLLLAGLALVTVRRWGAALPFGAFTIVFGLNALLMGLMRDEAVLVPGAVLAGLVADGLVRWLRPAPERPMGLRLLGFAIPAAYVLLHLAVVVLVKGTWWSVHLLTGAVVTAGMAGWLLTYLVAAPCSGEARPAGVDA